MESISWTTKVETKQKVEEEQRLANLRWGQDFYIAYEENKVLERSEESKEGRLEDGRNSERCERTDVERD